MKTKRIMAGMLELAMLTALAACREDEQAAPPSSQVAPASSANDSASRISERWVPLSDGRAVQCLTWDGPLGNGSGMSCDRMHAKPAGNQGVAK
jgi:hypothetical protein